MDHSPSTSLHHQELYDEISISFGPFTLTCWRASFLLYQGSKTLDEGDGAAPCPIRILNPVAIDFDLIHLTENYFNEFKGLSYIVFVTRLLY